MQAIVHHKYYKSSRVISPGPVASVGDVNMTCKLKHSTPDSEIRFAPMFQEGKSKRFGNNVQDGDVGGKQARTYEDNWASDRGFNNQVGWFYQDLRVPDKRYEPVNNGIPMYSWYNKVATMYDARRTGELFLPLPGEYQLAPGEIPRGGQVVRNVGDLTDGGTVDPKSLKNAAEFPRNDVSASLKKLVDLQNRKPQNGMRQIPGQV